MRTLAPTLIVALCLSADAFAARCPNDLPVLFIVQDKSGSMNQPPDPNVPTDPTKWASAAAAVPQLASQFANRFRFGVHMFPGATSTFNCTVGSTVAPVPSTAAQVANVYNGATPGGGTPTAVSLDNARTYLNSLALTEPAYVLLITDGLPNCDMSLDANTCQATTPGCANNSCGLGSKDCLDDSQTRAAAQRLLAAGYKVYVVGFGTQVTSGNNKAVLDGIAQAGGTGSSYAVNNQSSLTNALNQIGYNATTCCKDVCTQGAAMCTASGQVQSCQMDTTLGCTNWVTNSCPTRSSCTGGACQSCTDQCTLNSARCVGNTTETCVAGPVGCTVWKQGQSCSSGTTCSNGNCGSCVECQAGEKRCAANGTEECLSDPTTGCTHWQGASCAPGTICGEGSCMSCTGTCTAGMTRCNGSDIETCEVDASGCTGWSKSATCTGYCSNGACGVCANSCSAGATRCNGGSVETCNADGNGCGTWTQTQTCGSGESCREGSCTACADTCEIGAKRCTGSTIEECSASPSGCSYWRTTGACAVGSSCGGGECRVPCTGEESAACDNGDSCQQFDEGYFCVPEKGLGDPAKVKKGCGCGSVDGLAAALAFGVMAVLTRRRRSAS
ncbi:MAG: vWA domain-containing protein [Myxococcaceae bacterium]